MKTFSHCPLALSFCLVALALPFLPVRLSAATHTVTSLADSGPGTLREAISTLSARGDTINFSVAGTITLTNGELNVMNDLIIIGPGAKILTVSGNHCSRVFTIRIVRCIISDLTIANGSECFGGGIRNLGDLRLTNCIVSGNGAEDRRCNNPQGGGIFNIGVLNISHSTLSDNFCEGDGGGIYSSEPLTLDTCTFSGNRARFGGVGGALYCNTANGGFFTTNYIYNSTISRNEGYVGGVFITFGGEASRVRIRNTIITGNDNGSKPYLFKDVNGVVFSEGYNLIGDHRGSTGWTSTDLLDADPLLGALQDNGGPTPTMALLPGSPAIDHGKSSCALDQRGLGRPYDDPSVPNAVGGDGSDIGAYESNGYTEPRSFPSITKQPRTHGTCVGTPVTLTVEAAGGHLSYAWRKFGQRLPGSSQTTFRIDAIHPAQSGPYDVVISNPCGSVTSVVAQVNVQSQGECAGNRIINGSFELPYYSGIGYVDSTAANFGLPGWQFAAARNQLYLGYGWPLTLGPQFDGRQVACLTGKGSPVALWQTVPTTPGRNYLLSFAQSEANSAAPPRGALTVRLGNMSRVFTRPNDRRYVVHTWAFTATSSSTTVRFEDATPADAPGNGPYIDAVSLRDNTARMIGMGTPFPIAGGTLVHFRSGPSLSGMNLGFYAERADGQQGIYASIEGPVTTVADLTTAIVGGAGNFMSFPGSPSISESNVAFIGNGAGGQQGVYVFTPPNPIKMVADFHTAIPNGAGNFLSFAGDPAISDQTVAFIGNGAGAQQGVYIKTPPNPIKPVADFNTAIPGGAGNFTGFPDDTCSLVGEAVAFIGAGAGYQVGVYVKLPDNPIWKVANTNTPIPGSAHRFVGFHSASYDGSMVAFGGYGPLFGEGGGFSEGGVYKAAPGGPLSTVANNHTAIPGGIGLFTDFGQVAIDSGAVAFMGWRRSLVLELNPPTGIYTDLGGILSKVVAVGDNLNGKTVTRLEFGPFGFSQGQVAFTATFNDDSQALMMATACADSLQGGLNLVVTTTDDHDDGVAGLCDCTLREAIKAANTNASAGTHRITFAPDVTNAITLNLGELVLTSDMIISGPGANVLTVSGNNASRVFHITGGASQISNLRIADGHASAGGGGIAMNGGSLTVSNCAITGCYAQGADVASQGGGAIAVIGSANLTIIASTLSSNTTPYYGGGIYLFNAPTVSLVNSTVSGNRTLDGSSDDAFGGGIFVGNGSTLNVTASTIANNSSVSAGGGVYKGLSGTVTLRNSLIAGNSAPGGPDCKGRFVSAGHNLVGNTSGSTGFGSTGDQLEVNPLIGPLQENGGSTFTHALLPGSPAIDAGDDAVLGAPYNLASDQRGTTRRYGSHVDVGSYEVCRGSAVVTDPGDDGNAGSLRDAIACALPGSSITFAPNATGTVRLTKGELFINKPLSIVGPGAALLVISGNTNSRVFHIGPQGDMDIYGLTITEGRVVGINGVNGDDVFPNEAEPGGPGETARGGGILNEGVLRLFDCMITTNTVQGGGGGAGGNNRSLNLPAARGGLGGDGLGGAVFSGGVCEFVRCTLLGNTAEGGPGGMGGGPGLGASNRGGGPGGAGGAGGGAGIFTSASATLENATLAGNRATGASGGAGRGGSPSGPGGAGGAASGGALSGTFTLRSCTVSGNSGSGGPGGAGGTVGTSGQAMGGGVNAPDLDLWNTLIAGNSGNTNSPDVAGEVNTHGYNLIGITDGSSGWDAYDLLGNSTSPLNALLGPCQDNGGPVWTMSLLAGSPALDKGHDQGHRDLAGDARGGRRVVDFPSIANAPFGDGSDIGAFEAGGDLRITDLRTNGSQVNIFFTTDAGWPYSLESKDTLGPGPWTLVPGSAQTGNGAVLSVLDTRPRVPKRFYRAVMSP